MATYKKREDEEAALASIFDSTKEGYSPITANQEAANYFAKLYMNRDDFDFDYNSDELYNMYKKQYQQNAQRSMQDTLGQAAALTGGYSSSYAQSAAQQSYDRTMQGLNDRIPELYQLALDRYNNEQSRLLEKGNYYASMAQNALANSPEYALQAGYDAIAAIGADYDGDLNKDAKGWYDEAKKSSDPANEFLRLAAGHGISGTAATALYNDAVNAEAEAYGTNGWGIAPAEIFGSEWWYRLGRSAGDMDNLLNGIGMHEYSRPDYNAMTVLMQDDVINAVQNYINSDKSEAAKKEFMGVVKGTVPKVKKTFYTPGAQKAIEDSVIKIIQNPNFVEEYKKWLKAGQYSFDYHKKDISQIPSR